MNRRRFLMGAGVAGAGLAAYPTLFEPEWIDFTRKQVRLPGLAPRTSLNLLHISDLHASIWVPMFMLERAIEKGIAARPDLICVTGDFVTYRSDFDRQRYVRALRRLADTAPCYAVLGNHDGGVWASRRTGFEDTAPVRSLIAEAGVRLLHNESQRMRVAGSEIRLVGVGDLWSYQIDAPYAFRDVDRKAEPHAPVVLMAHNPDSKMILGKYSWDLMLSGHTHGGQVVLPWWGPRFAPVIDKRYVAGLKPWGTRQIHVTRGVGSIGGVRFHCRPEVSLLELRA